MDVSSDGQHSHDGLDFIVEHPEYVAKLATAFINANNSGPSAIRVRKQMVELLAALCAHNEEGRLRTIETLDYYHHLKNTKHRMIFIVQELEETKNSDYLTALVAFINCLVISTSSLIDRIRIRNEFIECQLLQVLNLLRKSNPEANLIAQLEVFDEQYKSDEAEFKGIDLNSHLDVFYAILKQIADIPHHATSFLNILQCLLNINRHQQDSSSLMSDVIWDNVEKFVEKATNYDKKEDIPRLLRLNSRNQLKLNCTCQQQSAAGSRRQSLQNTFSPPPPPPPSYSLPPPPPPPPFPSSISDAPKLPNSMIPPPPPCVGHPKSPPPDKDNLIERLPQQEIPAPKSKMKTVNWNKIPSNKVVGTDNIWTKVAVRHQNSPLADIDWSEMEGLFCQQIPISAAEYAVNNAESNEIRSFRKRKKECQEITLLDGKRSLNVNIFLKQFRSSNEDIIRQISNGENVKIGIEKLKGLLKILPEVDELDMLKSFDGDLSKLGNAEKFLIQLTNLPNYKLRIESMLLKEEFQSNMNYVRPSIRSMILAAQELMTNKALQEVLYMILIAGNFLNAGGYAGNAAGVKLTSLQKIMDIRANKPNMNLIHFVASQAEKRGNILLTFTENIGVLEEAAKTTVEQLKNEITVLAERIKKIKRQIIELPNTENDEIKDQMRDFLIIAETDVVHLQNELAQLDSVREQLAEFFCEDLNSFKIEECFRIFHQFTCKFKQAVIENERRKLQEEQANARKKQREELLAAKRRQMESLNVEGDEFIEMRGREEEEFYMASSPLLPRHRLSSFNSCGKENDKESPESSPNGSLRRRRSKGMLDDQGNLLDFLRNTSDCSNRERRSWGSLDRSWARKAKGTGSKKRPGLFNADFLFDRDRTTTPSPVIEVKGSCSAPEEELINKAEAAPSKKLDDEEKSHHHHHHQLKDKSAWRKSTLNVPNSSEEIRNHRRENFKNPDTRIDILQPIFETNDRKELIGALGKNLDTEKLTLYIRKPAVPDAETAKSENFKKNNVEPNKAKLNTKISNKIEIDQDNAQTPPMARKSFISLTPTEKREPVKPTPCKRILNKSEDFDADLLGDFNRFSPIRRTRRQVRPQLKLKVSKDEEINTVAADIIKSPTIMINNSLLGDFVSPVCIKVEPPMDSVKIINVNNNIKSTNLEKTLPNNRYSNISDLSSNKADLDPSSANKSKVSNSSLRRSNSIEKNGKFLKNITSSTSSKPLTLRRNSSMSSAKTKIISNNSKSSENFKILQDNNAAALTSANKPAVINRRSSSNANNNNINNSNGTHPKKPSSMGFMKPTTSSTTKSQTPTVRRSFSLRSRN